MILNICSTNKHIVHVLRRTQQYQKSPDATMHKKVPPRREETSTQEIDYYVDWHAVNNQTLIINK